MRSQDILVKSLTVDEGEADVVVQEDIPKEEKWVYVQDQTFILLDSFMVNRPLEEHFDKLMWYTKEEY